MVGNDIKSLSTFWCITLTDIVYGIDIQINEACRRGKWYRQNIFNATG